MSDHLYSSDLFSCHPETDQAACNQLASQIAGNPVRPLKWQGANTYTVEARNPDLVVQFRSPNESFDMETTALAKTIYGNLAPATEYRGLLPDSEVSIWTMEKLPGVGFDYLIFDESIVSKLETIVSDMASFYAASWKKPQSRTEEQFHNVRIECVAKLAQLRANLPDHLQGYVDRTITALPNILQLPWVLTHADLSSSNLLFDQNTGHLTGVIDWADAALWPFGKSLWGLENVLGYGNNDGWHWLDDDRSLRQTFQRVFLAEVGELSSQQRACIEDARVLGLLLRWAFVWRGGLMIPQGPADDQYHSLEKLSVFLSRKLL